MRAFRISVTVLVLNDPATRTSSTFSKPGWVRSGPSWTSIAWPRARHGRGVVNKHSKSHRTCLKQGDVRVDTRARGGRKIMRYRIGVCPRLASISTPNRSGHPSDVGRVEVLNDPATWFGADALAKDLCDELKTTDDVLLEMLEVRSSQHTSPHHPPHSVPVLATSSWHGVAVLVLAPSSPAQYTGTCLVIQHTVHQCSPRHPPHSVPGPRARLSSNHYNPSLHGP